MEITTLIGFVAVIGALIFGIAYSDGGLNFSLLMNFVSGPGIFIVIGGTLFALLAAFPIDYFKQIPKHLKIILNKDKKDPFEYVEIITELSREARKKGLLALEDKALSFEDEFLKESVLLIVDAIEPDKLRSWLEQKLAYINNRNEEERRIYQQGAALAPAFGMIGTLIGLVNMLKSMNLENGPGTLGLDMSVALITTFYGTVLANCLFIPISNKLEIAQEKEILLKEMIIEGVVSIKEGENPKFIQEKLLNFLEQKEVKEKDNEEEKKEK
ncbi:MAG: MotA/TolQ/ExbB proton channel family protein [Eubacteriales bacterium]|nr:MotA/TolQ/ExbB proton channel family protein [Eubacteriales bacterium]